MKQAIAATLVAGALLIGAETASAHTPSLSVSEAKRYIRTDARDSGSYSVSFYSCLRWSRVRIHCVVTTQENNGATCVYTAKVVVSGHEYRVARRSVDCS